MEKSAAIYARMSTHERAIGRTMDNQVEQLRTYLKDKGYNNIKVFVDEGYSGKGYNRPGIQRLLLELNSFDAVAVESIDRISRNCEDAFSLVKNYLQPANKKLLIKTSDIDSSSTSGYMFLKLLSMVTEYQRKIMSESISFALKKRAQLGKRSGRIMFGYDLIDGRLTINKEESAIVKEIFELRSNKKSFKRIAEILNNKESKTKLGNRFSINAVKTIIENPIYAGYIKYNFKTEECDQGNASRILKGEHCPIIDTYQWNTSQMAHKFKIESSQLTS